MDNTSTRPRRVANKTIISEDLFTGEPVLQEAADLYPLSKAEYMVIRNPPAHVLVSSFFGAGLGALVVAGGQWINHVYDRKPIIWFSNEAVGSIAAFLLAAFLACYFRFRHSEYRLTMSELRDHFNPPKKGAGWFSKFWRAKDAE